MGRSLAVEAKAGFVYLLYDGISQLSKIGCTTRESGRRQQAIMGGHGAILVNILNIKVSDCFGAEAQCHAHFAPRRRNGEWFAVAWDEAMNYLIENVAWQEMDLESQARLGKYLWAAKFGNHRLMHEAIKGPNSPYLDRQDPPCTYSRLLPATAEHTPNNAR